jgi:hypothetical protein
MLDDLNSLLPHLVLILFWTSALKCSAQTFVKTHAKEKTIELKQQHYFFGNLKEIASMTGLRLESTGSWKFVLVAKAPDWKVTVFRNDDKIFYSCPLKKFLEGGGLVSQYLFGKKSMYAEGNEERSRVVVGGVRAKRLVTPYSVCEFLPGKTLVASEVASILYESLRMPTGGGVALKFVEMKAGTDWMTGLNENGEQHMMLSTQSASEITPPANVYTAPSGYKLSKSLREVLISNETRASSTDAKDLFEIRK